MRQPSGFRLLAFRDVSIALGGTPILQNIDITVGPGEFVCVVGPSGCGKTTLLRLAAGLLQPGQGRVEYDGRRIAAPTRDIAIVFQDYGRALLPWRTVAGNVALALEAIGMARSERPARVAALLDTMGLARHSQRYPAQLSGGMQQRVQIARCLAQGPALLLMDEPFGALDAMTRQAMQDELLGLAASRGTSALFVTHDLDEAIYLGDRVIAMRPNPGRVADVFDVALPRPRHQLTTRESPDFLALRRTLFDFVQQGTE